MTGTLTLAFDTATEHIAIGLALRTGEALEVIGTRDAEAPRAALARLLPSVEDLLIDHAVRPSDVSEVVVGHGPGSFTGVRIAVSAAKGLAHGLEVPLYAVSTLDAVAWRLAGSLRPGTLIGVLGDAMRGEVYPALFEVTPDGVKRLTSDRVATPDAVAGEWASLENSLVLTGNGLTKYHDLFATVLPASTTVADPAQWSASGSGLLAAFHSALLDGALGDGDPATVLPVYTRLSDAEENERARTRQGPGER